MNGKILAVILVLTAAWLLYAEIWGPDNTKYISKLAAQIGGNEA